MASKDKQKCSWFADQSGVAAVLFALCAALLVGLVALSVDVGHIGVVRTELQNAADACALAGARGFFPNTVPAIGTPQPPPDNIAAESTANGWIGRNAADNQLLISLSIAQAGVWDYTGSDPNNTKVLGPWEPILPGAFSGPGITVTVRKETGSNDGPIHHALAAVFGVPTSDAQATATAALSGVGSTEPGQANFPGAITRSSAAQTNEFTLHPNGSQTGAWQSFFDKSTNWKTLTDYLTGSTLTPATKVGDEINTTNGVDTKTFTAPKVGLEAIFASHAKPWIVTMPVIGDSENPGGQPQKIIGYAAFEITGVQGPPDKTITLKPTSGYLGGGAGGGGTYFGLWSMEPKLVQVK